MSTIRRWALSMSWFFLLPVALCASTVRLASAGDAASAAAADDDAHYDRLDGHGPSGEKVDVVEWEGNLEIHVAPRGSLRGLSLKLDDRNKDKPVMVIGYRFADHPETRLVRRAILGISLKEGFRTYRDPSEPDYDKIIVSMNGLGEPLVAYKLDPAPSQLYPDGHPALAKGQKPDQTQSRSTASQAPARPASKDDVDDHESGTIRPFFMRSP